MSESKAVYIVDGARTPFLKARTHVGPFSSSDLATFCGQALLLRQNFQPNQLDEIILGSTVVNAAEPNVARIVGLRLGAKDVPAFCVQRNCASGLQA
ncbi:MAG: acetyl-CoA C-acyltransferase, partial [Gammaproteobacteria bacterium]